MFTLRIIEILNEYTQKKSYTYYNFISNILYKVIMRDIILCFYKIINIYNFSLFEGLNYEVIKDLFQCTFKS